MTINTTKPDSLQPATEMVVDLFDNWFDPIETEVRARARQFIEELIRGELDAALARPHYGRSKMAGNEARAEVTGHRHGSRTRSLTGTFGPIEIAVPRARLTRPEGGTVEWKSQALRAYQRRTLAAVPRSHTGTFDESFVHCEISPPNASSRFKHQGLIKPLK
jgi:putative transposase